jgi:hypothetical protein
MHVSKHEQDTYKPSVNVLQADLKVFDEDAWKALHITHTIDIRDDTTKPTSIINVSLGPMAAAANIAARPLLS